MKEVRTLPVSMIRRDGLQRVATGMCLECQCDVFCKELPEDVSRWVLDTE